jgi:3-oxoacyl-[acyl-carrier protein] reductase
MTPVALITGASKGIGRATAQALAKLNYRLALVARSSDDLAETARALAPAETLTLPADVTNPEQVRQLVDRAATHFGRLDALVCAAGLAPMRTIADMTIDEWHTVIDTNLSAVFYLTKYAWPHLAAAAKSPLPAHPHGSTIVNLSSFAARDPFPGFAAYGAAKAGLNVFDLVAARESAPANINVHTIAPAAVETTMFRSLLSPDQYPPEKTLSPEDVAATIVDCLTGRLRHTRGEVIYVRKSLD